MKLTDHRIVAGVGMGIVALGALGFALGLQQGQRAPAETQPLPLPVNTGHPMNLQGVPAAAALDPAAANGAIDPVAARLRARRAQADADNTMDDGGDEPTSQTPAPLQAAEPAEPVHPAPKAATPAPAANAVHGPY
jgi:hypothetical protein